MFWKYFTSNHYGLGGNCEDPVASEGIVGLMTDGFPKSELWYVIHDNLAPRLKGKLGKTLLGLHYTGNFLQLQYFIPTENPVPDPPEYDYLTLGLNQSAENTNWHAGFLDDAANSDNKYFLLANLLTNVNDIVQVKIEQPVPGYHNYRFRNIEGIFDTTFNTEITYSLSHPKGEGYLYQVAPVVKYGGTLTVNDTIDSDITLTDDMTISNNIELIVEDEYAIAGTVTLEGTGFITGNGYIYFNSNGEIIINRWDKALFKSKSDTHPMLIWGEYPSDTIAVTGYKIYRKVGGSAWQLLDTVADSIFLYVDETLTITPPDGGIGDIVQYKVTATYGSSGETPATNIITEIVNRERLGKKTDGSESLILEYSLAQNYPNPFNPSTTISYSIKYDNHVSLKIYDILGNEVIVLVDKNKTAGKYTVEFDASALSSGVYVYQLRSGNFIDVKKMILLK
jgi:hypothetical protein